MNLVYDIFFIIKNFGNLPYSFCSRLFFELKTVFKNINQTLPKDLVYVFQNYFFVLKNNGNKENKKSKLGFKFLLF